MLTCIVQHQGDLYIVGISLIIQQQYSPQTTSSSEADMTDIIWFSVSIFLENSNGAILGSFCSQRAICEDIAG